MMLMRLSLILFVSKNDLVLIDNHVDDSVLTLFSKRNKGVTATDLHESDLQTTGTDAKNITSNTRPLQLKPLKTPTTVF